jgi:hypothetical protein
MKREHAAAAATILVIVAVVAVLAWRGSGGAPTNAEAKPSTVVFDLYQRAKAGDVGGYLACLDGDLRRSVESSRRDMGDSAFRQHLQAIGKAVKGVSVTEERSDANEARLRVELVYADRTHNDVQTFSVARRRGRWLIAGMSGAQALQMPIPYGTPAYPLEPGDNSKQGTAVNGEQGTADGGGQGTGDGGQGASTVTAEGKGGG